MSLAKYRILNITLNGNANSRSAGHAAAYMTDYNGCSSYTSYPAANHGVSFRFLSYSASSSQVDCTCKFCLSWYSTALTDDDDPNTYSIKITPKNDISTGTVAAAANFLSFLYPVKIMYRNGSSTNIGLASGIAYIPKYSNYFYATIHVSDGVDHTSSGIANRVTSHKNCTTQAFGYANSSAVFEII